MAVIDCFAYNGESDILKLHLEILNPYVDKFVICEAKTTFSGKQKPLYFFRDQRWFKSAWKKIHYHVIDEHYTIEEMDLAQKSPNTKGAQHWKREFLQKESIHKALRNIKAKDDDTIFVGDVDEIINPEADYTIEKPTKAKLDVYAYYLNNRSSEQFSGTLIAQYGDIKDNCLNHLRSNSPSTKKQIGWHFTSMGGYEEVKRKLNDSYTEESYNTKDIQSKLEKRVTKGTDYLGRDFTFSLDESNWPLYLKENRENFKHLLLNSN